MVFSVSLKCIYSCVDTFKAISLPSHILQEIVNRTCHPSKQRGGGGGGDYCCVSLCSNIVVTENYFLKYLVCPGVAQMAAANSCFPHHLIHNCVYIYIYPRLVCSHTITQQKSAPDFHYDTAELEGGGIRRGEKKRGGGGGGIHFYVKFP